jgi:hypothetical protein
MRSRSQERGAHLVFPIPGIEQGYDTSITFRLDRNENPIAFCMISSELK